MARVQTYVKYDSAIVTADGCPVGPTAVGVSSTEIWTSSVATAGIGKPVLEAQLEFFTRIDGWQCAWWR